MRSVRWLLLPALAVACSQPEPPPRPAFIEAEDRAHYAAALVEFGLDRTALGRDWLEASDRALAEAVPVSLPFRESGYIAPSTPTALAYRVDLERGRALAVDVAFDGDESARLFIELFEVRDEADLRLVAEAAPHDRRLVHEIGRTAPYVLRVQPELLRGGRITIVERSMASLGFPVQGLSLRAVQSVFGDPRDGGRRDHHGVDIFAPRGTPVVAAVDGSVRVDTGSRGGRLIWLYPASTNEEVPPPGTRRRRGRRLYYAHLNDWAVQDGQTVRAGDVIGYVGNTGNARTTSPHLHFGVYDRGAVDPVPFLRPDDAEPAQADGPLDVLGRWVRVARPGAALRDAPLVRSAVLAELDPDVVLRVRAATGGYYRIAAPDGASGYVRVRDVTPAVEPIAREAVPRATDLRAAPDPRGSVIEILAPAESVEVLGRFGTYRLVRLPDARIGWVAAPADGPEPPS